MKATDLAYAAGFIDGEGSILVGKTFSTTLGRDRYQLVVSVTQVDKSPLIKLSKLFGGVVHKAGKTKNNKDFYRWYCSGKFAIELLNKILPFLLVKKEEALVALRFRRTLRDDTRHIPEKDFQLRKTLYHKLKDIRVRKYGKSLRGQRAA